MTLRIELRPPRVEAMGAGRWNSWEEASRRPWRALGGAFAVAAVATGLISYYDGWTPRSAWDSAVIGVGCE